MHNKHNNAVKLDKKNGNSKWQDTIKAEIEQQHECKTCKDLGIKGAPPPYHKKTRAHFVFDAKHNRCHKARLVADGNLIEVPLSSAHSGVESLRGIRLVLFLAELNELQSWGTDVGNAYLEANTKEKAYIVAGLEFGNLQDCDLLI